MPPGRTLAMSSSNFLFFPLGLPFALSDVLLSWACSLVRSTVSIQAVSSYLFCR